MVTADAMAGQLRPFLDGCVPAAGYTCRPIARLSNHAERPQDAVVSHADRFRPDDAPMPAQRRAIRAAGDLTSTPAAATDAGRPGEIGSGVGTTLSTGMLPDVAAALVALRAVGHVERVREIRCTGILKRPDAGWSTFDRTRLVEAVCAGGQALIGGHFVDEPLGERRWLAWFPQPLGPHHAVNVPSPVVQLLAARVPGIQLVRCHLAVRAWQAELLQAMGNLAQFEAGRRRLRRWAARGSDDAGEDARWATVVEVLGDPDLLVRGWAHGTHRRATAAALVAHGAMTDPTANVMDVSTPQDAAHVLDAVAAETLLDLRWSVGTPAPIVR